MVAPPDCRGIGMKTQTSRLPCGRDRCLLENLPERLVLEGFRHWLAGYETGSIDPWELGWNLFARELGPRNGRDLFSAVSSWARECHAYAQHPLQTFPFNCSRICRDECLALASIAAHQHGDEKVADFCLTRMIQHDGVQYARRSASDLADTLTAHGFRLMPVPFPVIASIALDTPTQKFH